MRYWNGYQWKQGQAPKDSGRITECETYDEFKSVFGGKAEETDEELKERVRMAFVPPPRSDIEGYYVGESHPPVRFPCADLLCPGDHGKPSSLLALELEKADALRTKAVDQNDELLVFGSYGEGLDAQLDAIKATELKLIKLGCPECTFTWTEADRDDMILTGDHNSHFTEPCPGSGEPAVLLT